MPQMKPFPDPSSPLKVFFFLACLAIVITICALSLFGAMWLVLVSLRAFLECMSNYKDGIEESGLEMVSEKALLASDRANLWTGQSRA